MDAALSLMNMQYKIVVSIIILEISLIIVVVLATLLFKLFGYIKEYNKQQISMHIEHYIKKLIESHAPFEKKRFLRKWHKT